MFHYWQLFDDYHLLSHTLCKLNDDVRVDSNDVPTTISTPGSASKEAEKKLEKEFKEKVSNYFSQLACKNSLNQHRIETKNFRELRSEHKDCNDEEEKSMLKKDAEESETFLDPLKTNLGF